MQQQLLTNAEQIKLHCQFSGACAQLIGKSDYYKLQGTSTASSQALDCHLV